MGKRVRNKDSKEEAKEEEKIVEALPCEWPKGRPPKYHSGLCEDLINKMSLGWSNIRIAADWDVSEETFYSWIRSNEEFAEAYTLGKTKWEAWWEEFGYKLMTGQVKGEFKAWIAYMNRKFHWSGTNPNISSGDTINIGNMNMLNVSPAEIDKKLANFMDKYGATSITDLKTRLLEDSNDSEG